MAQGVTATPFIETTCNFLAVLTPWEFNMTIIINIYISFQSSQLAVNRVKYQLLSLCSMYT